MGRECGGVGVSNADALAAGLRSRNDLYAANRDLQDVGQEAAAGGVGLPFYGWGADRYFEAPILNAEDRIPPGPRLDENGKEEITPPAVQV